MKQHVVTYAVLFMFLAAVPGVVGWGQAASPAAERRILIGAIFGFTGPMAVGGEGVCGGIRDYLTWVDQKGGIEYTEPSTGKKERVKIPLVWEDSQGDPGKSVMVYKRLKGAGAKVIVGFTSSSSEAVAAMASQDKIPLVALYAYASPAGYKSNPLYYTASFPTITECVLGTDKWFIDQWKGSRRPKIAALAADFPSFRSLEYLQKNPDTVKKLGGDWVGLEWMPPTPIDLRVQIGRLVDAGADLISLQGTLAHAKVVAMNVAQLNIDTKKVAIALAPAGTDENVVKFLGEQGEGFYGEVATVSADADVPGNKLVKEIMAARGRPAAKNVYHYRAGIALAHAPVAAIKAALEKVGYDKLTSTDIRNALFTLKNVDTGGLMPPMTVRESDYPVLTNHYRMTRIQGGRLVSVSGFYELGRLPEARW